VNTSVTPEFTITLPRGRSLALGRRTLVMGIVNITPDSFSDGGRFLDSAEAIEHAASMAEEGADIIDIGGESTRPGAEPVSVQDEISRVIGVIEKISGVCDLPISIDTTKAEVAHEALAAGASIVNDVTGLHGEPALAAVAGEFGAPVIAMHIKGTPRTMQASPTYEDVVADICTYLRESIATAEENGVPREQVIIDPGIGFGKTVRHNLEIMARLRELGRLGRPILVGTSRKSTIGKITGRPVEQRLFGTAATVAVCVANGAHIVRVHDVAAAVDVCRMTDAICRWREYIET